MNLCAPDQGVFAIANVGLPVQYCRPNEKQATGNNERKVRSILLLGGLAVMTTAIQFWLLGVSLIFEATVCFRELTLARHGIRSVEMMLSNTVLIGLALWPVLIVLRRGTKWPRACAVFLAFLPAFYIYGQVAQWTQP